MAVTTGEDTGGEWAQDEESRALSSHIGELLEKCKTITKSLKIGRPSRCLCSPQPDLLPPLGDISDSMVKLYLESFGPVFRVLHVPTFQVEFAKFRESPETAKPDVLLKILLVVGLGSSLATPDPVLRNRVQQWIHAAQTWLSGPLEKDRLGISGLQVYCLLLLARQVFALGGDLIWMSVGSLTHRAMQMGLHRDPRFLPPMPTLHAEVRRRLWATILELTVQSSLDAAMPPRISVDEYDTEPPSNVDDEDINDSSDNSIDPKPRSTYTTASLQLILLDSVPLRIRILKLLNGLHSSISYEEVLTLSSELTKVLRKCGSHINDNRRNDVTPFHRNLMDHLVRRFMIPLHCAFTCKARTTLLYQSSLKVSLEAALALISPAPDEGFARILAMGGGFVREGLRYSCSVLSLELIAETEAQHSEGTLYRVSAYRSMIKQAMQDFISLAAERIRQGENNVKMHMFLSMMMAQVEATEEGVPVARHMVQRGRDSLVFCYDILQERASGIPLSTAGTSQDPPLAPDGWQYGVEFDWNAGLFMPSMAFF